MRTFRVKLYLSQPVGTNLHTWTLSVYSEDSMSACIDAENLFYWSSISKDWNGSVTKVEIVPNSEPDIEPFDFIGELKAI